MARKATKTIEHEPALFNDPPATKREVAAPKKTSKAKQPAPPPKQEVAKVEPKASNVVPLSDAARMLELIGNMAMNKGVDADKFEKLLSLQERMIDRQAKRDFDDAFLRMWPMLPAISKDGRIVIEARERTSNRGGMTRAQGTPYAKWETMMPIIRPILVEHGFSLTHRIGTAEDHRVRVTAVLKGWGHTDDSCYFDLPADVGGSKNNVQAWASSVSYAKRHTAFAILNIVTRGEDDDGKSSGKPVVVGDAMDDEDVEQLRSYCEAAGLTVERLVGRMNELRPRNHSAAAELKDLPKARFDEAVKLVQNYSANKAAAEAEAKK